MKTDKLLFCICIIFSSLGLEAKDNKNSLDSLCIVNNNLSIVLDSIVEHEKQCEYYDTKLIFIIRIHLNTNANNQNPILIGLIGNKAIKTGREVGGFRYKGHLFIVDGDSIDITLFCKTDKKIYSVFSKSRTNYNKKTRKWFFDIDAVQDDSYSYWYYLYENGIFIFENKSTYCETNLTNKAPLLRSA